MSFSVMLIVLFAAILHASWNFLVKNNSDKHMSMSAVVIGHTPFAILALCFVPLPSIVFVLILGVFVLKEKLDLVKLFASMCTLLGASLLRIGK